MITGTITSNFWHAKLTLTETHVQPTPEMLRALQALSFQIGHYVQSRLTFDTSAHLGQLVEVQQGQEGRNMPASGSIAGQPPGARRALVNLAHVREIRIEVATEEESIAVCAILKDAWTRYGYDAWT